MKGIIYCYTSPSGKKYIGQTTNEINRRSMFNNLSINYCSKGGKIDRARHKYGPQNFIYEVLECHSADTKNELLSILNERECYFIKLYDTCNNGYNTTIGGNNFSKKAYTAETRKKISDKAKERCAGTTPAKLTGTEEKRLQNCINKCSKPIYQLDRNGNIIREWSSAIMAAKELNLCSWSIRDCARGKYKSSGGFYWRFVGDPVKTIKTSTRTRTVGMFSLDNQLLKVFDSPSSAGAETGINRNIISSCCRSNSNNGKHQRNGYIWKYI